MNAGASSLDTWCEEFAAHDLSKESSLFSNPDSVRIEHLLEGDQRKRATTDIKQVLLARYVNDPTKFFQEVLPEWFTLAFAPMHLGLIAILCQNVVWLQSHPQRSAVIKLYPGVFRLEGDILMMKRHHKTACMIPRGFAKTTIVRGCLLWNILYGKSRFAVVCSETSDAAASSLRTIKGELEGNKAILHLFGTQKPSLRDGTRKWSEDTMYMANGSIITARGTGSQMRGMNLGGVRPDLIVCDDIESSEGANSETQRRKTTEWAMGDMEPALVGKESKFFPRIVVIGTLLHPEQQLCKWQADDSWLDVTFGCFDDMGTWLWPEKFAQKEYDSTLAYYENMNIGWIFYREFNSKHIPKEACTFHPTDIQDVHEIPTFSKIVLGIDPAISESVRADYTAMVLVGVAEKGYYILESQAKRCPVSETMDDIFDICDRWHVSQVGIEAITFQKVLMLIAQEESLKRGRHVTMVPITHGKVAKTERVEGLLEPIFKNKHVFFYQKSAHEHHKMLKSQLLEWPGGRHDDVPDALSMAMKLVAGHQRQALARQQLPSWSHFSGRHLAVVPRPLQGSPRGPQPRKHRAK